MRNDFVHNTCTDHWYLLKDFILSLLYIIFYEVMNANFHILRLFKKGSGFQLSNYEKQKIRHMRRNNFAINSVNRRKSMKFNTKVGSPYSLFCITNRADIQRVYLETLSVSVTRCQVRQRLQMVSKPRSRSPFTQCLSTGIRTWLGKLSERRKNSQRRPGKVFRACCEKPTRRVKILSTNAGGSVCVQLPVMCVCVCGLEGN